MSDITTLSDSEREVLDRLDTEDQHDPRAEDILRERPENKGEDINATTDELADKLGEDDDAPDTDEAEPQAEPAPQTYKVKVDGGEIEVTLDELQAGYSRHSDYSRKTQALAAEREQYGQNVAAVLTAMQAMAS